MTITSLIEGVRIRWWMAATMRLLRHSRPVSSLATSEPLTPVVPPGTFLALGGAAALPFPPVSRPAQHLHPGGNLPPCGKRNAP